MLVGTPLPVKLSVFRALGAAALDQETPGSIPGGAVSGGGSDLPGSPAGGRMPSPETGAAEAGHRGAEYGSATLRLAVRRWRKTDPHLPPLLLASEREVLAANE